MLGQKQKAFQDRVVSLEQLVPQDHFYRKLEAKLDLHFVYELVKDCYASARGRPSIDPVLMIRMLIVGYCYGIRFERRLCQEVELHLAYRWFCRLGLEEAVPEHSTFSKNRHGRFRDSQAFRHVFESVLQRCELSPNFGDGLRIRRRLLETRQNCR